MPLIPREILNERKTKTSVYKKRNRVFGPLADIRETFNSPEVVLDHIFRARYAKTVGECSSCGSPYSFYKKVPGRLAYRCLCKKSRMIFPLKGTPLEHCKIPLPIVIEIIYELFCSKHGFTATELERKFGFKNETCHLILDKISQLFGLAIFNRHFASDSIIEVDEVYPYVQTGLGEYHSFKRGLGSERLQTVVTFTERDNNGKVGITKAFAVEEANSKTLKKLFSENTKASNIIYTDESKIYNFLEYDEAFKGMYHNACNHRRKEWANGDCHVNTVEGFNSFVKKTIHSIYLGVSKPKVQLYLNRVAFVFSFRDRNMLEVFEILFSSLPELNNSIEHRITCNRTKTKWSEAA